MRGIPGECASKKEIESLIKYMTISFYYSSPKFDYKKVSNKPILDGISSL